MKYRDLKDGDVIQPGDEYYSVEHRWIVTSSEHCRVDGSLRYRRPIPEDKYGTRIQDGDEYEVSEGVWEKVHPDSVGLPQSLFTNYRRPPLDLSATLDGEPLSVWISVEDALPDDIDDVLLICKDSDFCDAGWYDEQRGWILYTSSGEDITDDVTHWHPAPPLPEPKPAVDPGEEAFAAYMTSTYPVLDVNGRDVAVSFWAAALAYARKERE